jgi:hypothetical protein
MELKTNGLGLGKGVVVDSETRRKKQQALMTEALERKIRRHAQRRYDDRGQQDGSALEDWIQAESEVLENNILAPLYRKSREENPGSDELSAPQLVTADPSAQAGV